MGVGHGKVRISVLFRPVKLLLAPSLLGFDIGRVSIANVKLKPDSSDRDWSKYELCLRTTGCSSKLSRKVARQENDDLVWDAGQSPVQLSVLKRYSSAVVVKVRATGVIGAMGMDKAMAVIWLRDVVDGKQQTITTTLWSSNDFTRLKQNYYPLKHDQEDWVTETVEATRVGSVELDLSFIPGISQEHEKHMRYAADLTLRKTWEGWIRMEYLSNRKETGQAPQKLRVDMESESYSGNAEADANTTMRRSGDRKAEESSSELDDEAKQRPGHQEKLHLEHRGVMQVKPARTAEWMRENVRVGAEKLKNKMELNGRVPDVETEV